MAVYVIFILLVVIAIASLLVLFAVKAKEKYQEKKWGKLTVAILGALIALMYLAFVFVRIFPLTMEGMMKYGSMGTMIGIVLTWLAASLIKNKWILAAVVFSPLLYIAFIVFLGVSSNSPGSPITKAETPYSDQVQVSRLLGNVSLPDMEFKEAWQSPLEGTTVILELKNEADSAQLSTVFQKFKQQKPLKITDSERTGRVYLQVDNQQNSFSNVVFEPKGIKVVYGELPQEQSPYISQFDSISAPLPSYELLTYLREDFGQDWFITEKIAFEDSVPMTWLDQIKEVAETNQNWSLDEYEDSYVIGYRDKRFYQYFLQIKLFKDLEGERKVADLKWGKY